MCELLGFSADAPQNVSEYIRAFSTHSRYHPHGWGLALIHSTTAIVKEPVRADRSVVLSHLIENPLQAQTLMGHIRYATVGNVGYTNCHPFVRTDQSRREWILFHNGTVFESDIIAPYLAKQVGTTDSERILLYLIDRINEEIQRCGPLDTLTHAKLLDREIARISPGNKLNMMVYDGQTLFVHTNMAGTLYQKSVPHGIIFCTSPLDKDGWSPVPMRQVLGYQNGQQIFAGQHRSAEYIPSPEQEALLYQIFAEL